MTSALFIAVATVRVFSPKQEKKTSFYPGKSVENSRSGTGTSHEKPFLILWTKNRRPARNRAWIWTQIRWIILERVYSFYQSSHVNKNENEKEIFYIVSYTFSFVENILNPGKFYKFTFKYSSVFFFFKTNDPTPTKNIYRTPSIA